MRRHAQSKLVGLMEHLLALFWALAAMLACFGSPMALAPALCALLVLALNRPKRENGAGRYRPFSPHSPSNDGRSRQRPIAGRVTDNSRSPIINDKPPCKSGTDGLRGRRPDSRRWERDDWQFWRRRIRRHDRKNCRVADRP